MNLQLNQINKTNISNSKWHPFYNNATSVPFWSRIKYKNDSILCKFAENIDKILPYTKKICLKQREIQNKKITVIYESDRKWTNKKFLKTCLKIFLFFPIFILGVVAKTFIRYICLKNLPALLSSKHLIKAYGLELPQGHSSNFEVIDGYGDWIIRRRNKKTGDLEQVEKKEYAEISEIFKKNNLHKWEGSNEDRLSLIQKHIKHIDPDLETTFIPRTLYEMVFIRQTIEEDLLKKKMKASRPDAKASDFHISAADNTWTQVPLQDFHKPLVVHDNKLNKTAMLKIEEIAHRINGIFVNILKEIAPRQISLNYGQVSHLAENEIDYLRKLYQNSQDSQPYPMDVFFRACSASTGFTIKYKKDEHSLPLGLANEEIADIIRNAILLECDIKSRGKFIIYRGGNLIEDHPDYNGNPQSLSYGSSLFAGFLNDGTATAFGYMRQKNKDAYALRIDPKDKNSLFYIPDDNTFAQMFGEGENFHCRSRIWKVAQDLPIRGLYFFRDRERTNNDIRTNLTKEIICQRFDNNFIHAILLKSSKDIGVVVSDQIKSSAS